MESEPMLTPRKNPSTGKILPRGVSHPWRCIKPDSEPNTLPTSYSGPYTTCTDFYLALESQGQCKAKPIGFIFLHTFHLTRMKFDVVMKQCRLNILRLLMSKISWFYRNSCCFSDWQCFKLIWMEFGILLGLVSLVILISFCLMHSIFKAFCWEKFNVGLYSDICKLNSFNFCMKIGIT